MRHHVKMRPLDMPKSARFVSSTNRTLSSAISARIAHFFMQPIRFKNETKTTNQLLVRKTQMANEQNKEILQLTAIVNLDHFCIESLNIQL